MYNLTLPIDNWGNLVHGFIIGHSSDNGKGYYHETIPDNHIQASNSGSKSCIRSILHARRNDRLGLGLARRRVSRSGASLFDDFARVRQMTARTINNLQWTIESPSFFKLVGHDIRLVFDGAVWWLYSLKQSNSSMQFLSKKNALDWIEGEMVKMRLRRIER